MAAVATRPVLDVMAQLTLHMRNCDATPGEVVTHGDEWYGGHLRTADQGRLLSIVRQHGYRAEFSADNLGGPQIRMRRDPRWKHD